MPANDHDAHGETPVQPLRYEPAFERAEEDEAQTTREIIETLAKIARITFEDRGHAERSVHAKSHGLLLGELRISENLPPMLAQGLFAKPGTYPVVMRLSTIPGDILDDSVSVPRGMAIKLIGVDGMRLPGSEGDVTQDFVLVNGPAFLQPDAKHFLGGLKLLAATTDRVEPLKKAVSAVARAGERVFEAFGSKSGKLIALGGQPETHILGDTFYSQVPLLFGEYMAKVSLTPVAPELVALTNAPLDVNGKPNGLREAVIDYFSRNGGAWELRVQLCTDLDAMPIEDASKKWPESASSYLTVATLHVPPQEAWSQARVAAIDDGLSFSPWHGIAAHRPLGSIMRVRHAAYAEMSRARAVANGVSIREPGRIEDVRI